MRTYFHNYKYELLLFALLQHLFIGIFLQNLNFYTTTVWAINMIILGIASVGVFVKQTPVKRVIRDILAGIVTLLPMTINLFPDKNFFFVNTSLIYVLFFGYIFGEIIRFLIRPSYINSDIFVAAACGILLLVEINTFLHQYLFYRNPDCFKGLNTSSPAALFMDMVYFSCITLTSIGFGDIVPAVHYTKLTTSLFGITGQFYTVVLVGILISKFTSQSESN